MKDRSFLHLDFKNFCLSAVLLILFSVWAINLPAENNNKVAAPASGKIHFTKSIQPLLEKHCLDCHGHEEPESDFSLTSSASLLKGGLSGKVIIPGKAEESPLFRMISHQHEDEIVMPPEGEGEPLSKAEVELFRNWINEGANWPEKLVLGHPHEKKSSGKDHWSFQPIKKPVVPQTRHSDSVRNEIDSFILSRLESEDLSPSPEAEKRTLIRRVTLDLIGLLPDPAEVEEFLKDPDPNAYEKVVNRLLESPHYGEKWARPWLDLCHYGDTDGYLTDALRPVAWRYRDWVVNALNANMPFDQFTIEQLAGDLLPDSTVNQQLATGFLRQALSNREGGADLEEFRVSKVIDRTKMVGTSWLGLTLECCRCHNHKYDPISQKEFYQLYAFFNNDYEINVDAPLSHEKQEYEKNYQIYVEEREKLLAPVKKALEAMQAEWEKQLLHAHKNPEEDRYATRAYEVLGLVWGVKSGEGQNEGEEIIHTDPSLRTTREKNDLTDYFLSRGPLGDHVKYKELGLPDKLNRINELKEKYLGSVRAPAIAKTSHHRQAFVHLRGMHTAPGIPVEPMTPAFLNSYDPSEKPDRLALAEWLVSPENPLTSRVVMNRMWQAFFGKGFVLSSDDFGTQGDKPSHPELLDWLATRYIESGWNTKEMHKLIVMSGTYRQSSIARDDLDQVDPSNRLLARQSPLRLSAESVRDIALNASGLLSPKMGGPSVRPPQPKSVVEEGFGLNTWEVSEGEDKYRRGLYTLILRTSPFAQSVIFDSPNPANICTRRERSNTPLQALNLLNDPVFFEAAQALAKRVQQEAPENFNKQLEYAFELCFSRMPSPEELKQLTLLYEEELKTSSDQDSKTNKEQAATVVCSVLLNLHEFITRQ